MSSLRLSALLELPHYWYYRGHRIPRTLEQLSTNSERQVPRLETGNRAGVLPVEKSVRVSVAAGVVVVVGTAEEGWGGKVLRLVGSGTPVADQVDSPQSGGVEEPQVPSPLHWSEIWEWVHREELMVVVAATTAAFVRLVVGEPGRWAMVGVAVPEPRPHDV